MWSPAELTVQFDAQVLGLVGLGEFLVVDGVLCLDDFSLVCDAQGLYPRGIPLSKFSPSLVGCSDLVAVGLHLPLWQSFCTGCNHLRIAWC